MPEPKSFHDLQFRRSTKSDAQAVFDITANAVVPLAPEYYSPEVVSSWMDGRSPEFYHNDCKNGAIWIADDGAGAIAYAQGTPGEILRLFVDPVYFGQGIGSKLMSLALKDSQPLNSDRIRIQSTLNAVKFYSRWGFHSVGRGYFSSPSSKYLKIEVLLLERLVKPALST